MVTGKRDPYGFDPGFEASVVLLSCSRPRFFGRIGHALEPDLMGTSAAKLAVATAQLCARDAGHGPEDESLVLQRLRRLLYDGKVTQEQIEEVGDLFNLADDIGVPSEESVIIELAPVLKRRMEKHAVSTALEEYGKRGDVMRAFDVVAKAAALGKNDATLGTLVGAESFAEIDRLRRLVRLPTGVPELDFALEGGLPRGAEGVCIGGPGAGKSMCLSHIGAHGFLLGFRAAYATLELPVSVVHSRVISNVTGVPINEILEGRGEQLAAGRLSRLTGTGMLAIKEFTAEATTVLDLAEWVGQCEESWDAPIDILIVDYADKLTVPQMGRDDRDYTTMKYVYEALRQFAIRRKCCVWTASQSKGRDEQKRNLDLRDAADSMHKVRIADIVVTLRVEDDQVNFFVAKHRTGRSRMNIGPMPIDFARGRIAPVIRQGETA